MNKKCSKCHNIKSLEDFHNDKSRKDGHHAYCKDCLNKEITKYKNTETGFLRMRYNSLRAREFLDLRWGRKSKCHFTFDEFVVAWKKHKSIYGLKSAWGPGIDNLEQHLPITMIFLANGQIGKPGNSKGNKVTGSNLSIDRLNPNLDYTLQNIIFIRNDENRRKSDSSYEDCKIQIQLHEERFVEMKAI